MASDRDRRSHPHAPRATAGPVQRAGAAAGAFLLVTLPLSLVILPLSACAASDGDISTHRLPNGLGIYVVEKHSSPIAAVEIWYRTGALNERPGIRGLSHLFEHMMFRGSRGVGPQEHNKRIEAMGGWSNAYTNEDVTVYLQVVPVRGIDLVLEMEADRMAHLALDEKMLETEVEVVKEEYRVRVENNPMARLLADFARDYYGSHPYGYMVIGVMSDLDTVSVATCLAYYRHRYAPNNAALVVTGDVEPDSVFRMAERRFGSIPLADSVALDPPPPPPPPRELRGRTDLPIPITGVAYRLPPSGDPDHEALEVLTKLVGNRLEQSLVRESSLCVFAGPMTMPPCRQADLAIFMGVHLPSVGSDRVLQAIRSELVKILAEPVSQDELDRTRNPLLLEEALGRRRVQEIAAAVGNALFIAEDLDRYTERVDRIRALDPVALHEAARRHLTSETCTDFFIEPSSMPFWLRIASWFATTLHLM